MIWDAVADILEPPPQPDTWLEFSRKLTLPDGPYKGEQWDPMSEPVQAAIVQALDDGEHRDFLAAICSQTGKSLQCIQAPALKFTTQEEQAAAYILPTLDVLERNWTEKIKPVIEGCGYGDWLPKTGAGSKGGRPKALRLTDPRTGKHTGSLVFMAAGSGNTKEAALASSTVGAVLIDEVDDFTDVNHVQLGLARAASFGRMAWTFMACTVNAKASRDESPGKDGASLILYFYDLSTKGRMHYACPHCGVFQQLDLEHITYEGGEEMEILESARYACPHNGCMITDDERHEMLRTWRLVMEGQSVDAKGEVIGPRPRRRRWGILAGQLDFHLGLGIGDLAVEHYEAHRLIEDRGDHSAMRNYWQKRHSRSYTGDEQDDEPELEEISPRMLSRISQQRGHAECMRDKHDGGMYSRYHLPRPDDCTGAVLAVDVQQDRIYWTMTGYSQELTTWDLGYGYEYATAERTPWGPGDLASVLDRVDELADEWADGADLTDRIVDTGFETKELVKWLRQNRRWRGVRGVDSIQKTLAKRTSGVIAWDRKWKPGLGRFEVETTGAIGLVHDAIRKLPEQIGAAHLPAGLKANDHYLRHLASWRKEVSDKTNKLRWVQKQKRDDWLQCRAYGHAVVHYRVDKINLEEEAQEEQATAPPPPSGDWVTGGGAGGW